MPTLLIVVSTATPLFVGVCLLLLPSRPVHATEFAFRALACGLLMLPLCELVRWDFLGAWAKWGSLALLALVVAAQWQRISDHGGWALRSSKDLLPALAYALLAGGLLLFIHRRPAEVLVDLHMPLAGSRWYVAHGGSNLLTNHHNAVPAQKYALDLTVLGATGRRALGLQPESLGDYAAFGEPVVSPCDGRVLAVESQQKDQRIGSSDTSNPAGNYVAIQCDEITVVLAHLQAGSVSVAPQDAVHKGQLIGRVGNSGNSTEPHLHVHAVLGAVSNMDQLLFRGVGIPLSFGGRFLIRGDGKSSQEAPPSQIPPAKPVA